MARRNSQAFGRDVSRSRRICHLVIGVGVNLNLPDAVICTTGISYARGRTTGRGQNRNQLKIATIIEGF